MNNGDFFIAKMPSSRPADYYLGYMDGCVFMDFNNRNNNQVYLKRISFDGYGCCDLLERAEPLTEDNSRIFKNILQNNINDEATLFAIIKETITRNKKLLWLDALEEYSLI